jgi:hypothetical protein
VQQETGISSIVRVKSYADAVMLLMPGQMCKFRAKDQTYTNFQLTMVFLVSLHITIQNKKESV